MLALSIPVRVRVALLAVAVVVTALLGSVAVDVASGDDAPAADAHLGHVPVMSKFGGCHHEVYVDLWHSGQLWRSSRFNGPNYFDTNMYRHTASGWVWVEHRYVHNVSHCVLIGT